MRGLSRLFFYLKYSFEADTKEVRAQATKAAREWCMGQQLQRSTDAYRINFTAFTGAYMREFCHVTAKNKLIQRSQNG
jgi:hypothetical protein